MKKAMFLFMVLSFTQINAQNPIFDPSMSITEFGVVDSPTGEEVDKIIDGSIATKFLDFELDDGMGFTVDLGGVSIVANYIEITTANDFEVRDPMFFEVLGSNDGSSFTSIATGTIDCIPDRFFARTYEFTNTDDMYSHYRVDFTMACDPSGGTGIASIQLAEVQLFEPVLDVADSKFTKAITLAPNPSDGVFQVQYVGQEPLIKIEIIDLTGKVIEQLDPESPTIALEGVPSGLYFIKMATINASATKQILIK